MPAAWFPDDQRLIGTLPNLPENEPRLLDILVRAMEELDHPALAKCELLILGAAVGDLTGPYAGNLRGAVLDALRSRFPSAQVPEVAMGTSACASGADALAMAALRVDRGAIDLVGVLVVDSLEPGKLLQHVTLGTQSPTRARPFDRRRDGASFGEGAALVVVGNRDGVRRAGATPLARVDGVGFSCDAISLTTPDETGGWPSRALAHAWRMAAQVSAEPIAYLNAHGTATRRSDEMEARALTLAFPDTWNTIPVSGVKGATGHAVGAAGLVEAVITTWAMQRGCIPPTVGLTEPDERCGLALVPESPPLERAIRRAMSTGFGFGGQNSAIVLSACEDE